MKDLFIISIEKDGNYINNFDSITSYECFFYPIYRDFFNMYYNGENEGLIVTVANEEQINEFKAYFGATDLR